MEDVIQIIMNDCNFGDGLISPIDFPQVLNRFYLQKMGSYTIYALLFVSQWTMLIVVAHRFFVSLQIATEFSNFIGQLDSLLTISLQNQGNTSTQASAIRLVITSLNMVLITSFFILYKKKCLQSSITTYIQRYSYILFSLLMVLSLPIINFSIIQLKSGSLSFDRLDDFLDLINSLSIFAYLYALQIYSIDVECQPSKQSIGRFYRNNGGASKTIKLCLCCIVVRIDGPQIFKLVVYLCLWLIHVRQLKQLCRCRKYMNEHFQMITEFIHTIWSGTVALIIIVTLFPQQVIVHNITVIFLSFNGLLHLSFCTFRDYTRKKQLIEGYEHIKKQDQAVSYALELVTSMRSMHQHSSPVKQLLRSLSIQTHRAKCNNPLCHCQNKDSVSEDTLNKVTQNFLQQISSNFPQSFCLKFILIGFKLSITSKIINTNHEINEFIKGKSLECLSFEEKYILAETRTKIHLRFSEYNKIQNHIKCENIFLEEEIKCKTNSLLKSIINQMTDKHRLLLQDFYTLNGVEAISVRINSLICQMEVVWKQVCEINSFNHELYRLFIFYYQNVIPSQVEGKKITQEIMQKLDKLKHLKGFSRDIVNKYIYSRKSCVIESNLQQQFGVITNVSKYCFQVLGRKREDLLHKNINDLMPEYFVKGHQHSMQRWLQNCTVIDYKTDMVDLGYVDALQTCFQGCFLMKILPGYSSLLFYSVIIRENDNDYLLLNGQKQIEGIGKRLVKENVFTSENMKHKITEYGDINFDKKMALNQTYRCKIFFENTGKEEPETITDECIESSKRMGRGKCKFECMVSISKHSIGSEPYYLMKFENVTKWVSRSSQNFQPLRFGSKKMDDKHSVTLKVIDDQLMQMEEYESVEPVTNNIRFTQLLNLSIKNSSLSSNGFSEAAYYNHFIKNVKKKLISPALISINPFKKTTLLLSALSVLLIVEFFSLRSLFVVGFKSFNDVMFGDGAVSDNNQILEIMYNDVMMSRVYCQAELESARCAYLLNSTATISNYLYGLYLNDVEVYLQNRTALSGLKFYASYDIEVPFVLGSSRKEVSTLEFMEYYYAAVRVLQSEIAEGRGGSDEADNAIAILQDNWQSMKFVNHNAIYFYLAAGEQELRMLMSYLLVIGGGLLLCLALLAVGLKKYHSLIAAKKVSIISLHSYINSQLLRDITDYYVYLKEAVVELKFIPEKFEQEPEHLHQQNHRKMRYSHSKMSWVQISLIVLVISALGTVEILQIYLVLPSSLQMVYKINYLMDSENFLLENYFELKTYYLNYNFTKSVDQISSEISVHLNQSEPVWTTVAKDSLTLFAADPTFTDDFNNLLVADICDLTRFVLEPWQVAYCIHGFTTNLMSYGLTNAMTLFQRRAYAALSELKLKQHLNINKTEYFKQDVFKEIDDSIFYMFRLYQATQARMYKGLNYVVDTSLLLLDLLNATAAVILVCIMLWWIGGYRRQQQQISQLYGIVLQLPESVMKAQIITKIKMNLELED